MTHCVSYSVESTISSRNVKIFVHYRFFDKGEEIIFQSRVVLCVLNKSGVVLYVCAKYGSDDYRPGRTSDPISICRSYEVIWFLCRIADKQINFKKAILLYY